VSCVAVIQLPRVRTRPPTLGAQHPSTAAVAELVSTYNETLLSLIDIHAPLRRVRCSVRRSAAWYDGECRAAKRSTRLLERKYRRHKTPEVRTAWRKRFAVQRSLFYHKATDYWTNTVSNCSHNTCSLWSKIKSLGDQPTTRILQHFANDFANHFTTKSIRFVLPLPLPTVSVRLSTGFSSFQSMTNDEALKLILRVA